MKFIVYVAMGSGKKNSVRADENKKELIEKSIEQFGKEYNNNPQNDGKFSINVFNNLLKEKYSYISSETPLKNFRAGKNVDLRNFIAICEVLKLNPEDVIHPDDLEKIRTEPPYTPQTKTLKELESKKRFDKLIGRDNERNDILSRLSNSENNQIIVVDGIGGSGKTSLVVQAISDFCRDEKYLEYGLKLIWLTAKPYELTGNQIVTLKPAIITFETVLNEVAVKLGEGTGIETRPDIEQKKAFLRDKLGEESYLIIIDNLETVQDFPELVKNLEDFFIYSKVLLTSRRSVNVSTYLHIIKIKGFENPEDSIEFINQFLKGKPTARELIGDDTEKLLNIHELTGGLPLAMELIISQIDSGYLYEDVLEELTQVNCQTLFDSNADDDDIFNLFYRFIYEQSWKLLSKEEKQILCDIAAKPLATGLFLEDLQEDIPDLKLRKKSLRNLKQLNLIYYGKIDGMLSFFLHPLTHQFVKTK